MNSENIVNPIEYDDQLYTEEQLSDMGLTFTMQSYSKYLIFRNDNYCFLVDKSPEEDRYRIHLNFDM